MRCFRLPVYPWLLGIYPILFLFGVNIGLVAENEVHAILVATLIGITLAYILARILLGQAHQAAFLLTICILFFALSGHVYELILPPISDVAWSISLVLLAAITLALIGRTVSSGLFEKIAPVLNLIAAALLGTQLITILPVYATVADHERVVSAFHADSGARAQLAREPNSRPLPDIYYIIPDGYPSDSWLQAAMDYDNSAFTEALEERGFTVVQQAQTNYAATLPALASVLNMKYYPRNDSPFSNLEYLRAEIAFSEVAQALQSLGYTYIQFLSGYLFPSPIADINRDFTPAGPVDVRVNSQGYFFTLVSNEMEVRQITNLELEQFVQQSFISLYVDTTLLRALKPQLGQQLSNDQDQIYPLLSPERFLDTVDEVAATASMPEATFAIVHLMKPHAPVVFDGQGNIVPKKHNTSHEEYFAEFEFTNTKFLQLIDEILANSQQDPVIIFQADHGSTYGGVWSVESRLDHFDVYAAYYFPRRTRYRLSLTIYSDQQLSLASQRAV